MRVWGIEYTIKRRWNKWSRDWTGPCGIYVMTFCNMLTLEERDSLSGRPIFFRTRKLAREEAARKTGVMVKFRAVPFELNWKRV